MQTNVQKNFKNQKRARLKLELSSNPTIFIFEKSDSKVIRFIKMKFFFFIFFFYLETVNGVSSVGNLPEEAIRIHDRVRPSDLPSTIARLLAALVIGQVVIVHSESELIRLKLKTNKLFTYSLQEKAPLKNKECIFYILTTGGPCGSSSLSLL